MPNPSLITTQLTVDLPLVQNAQFSFSANDRQYLDNQIRGTQQHVVDLVIGGTTGTWMFLDAGSAAVSVGDNVCSASIATTARNVTKAVAAALTNAGGVVGVVLAAASPGSYVKVATGGTIAAAVVGLAAASARPVRVNTTTARCEAVASLGTTDYPIGFQDSQGNLSVRPGASAGAFGAGIAGDVTGTLAASVVAKITGSGGIVTLNCYPTFGAGVSNPLFQQATQTLDIATSSLTISSQAPFATATGANRNPGNLVYQVPAPVAGGTDGKHSFTVSGTEMFSVGVNGAGIGIAADVNRLRIDSAGGAANSTLRLTAGGLGGISANVFGADNCFITFDVDWFGSQFIARNTSAAVLYKNAAKLTLHGNTSLSVGSAYTTTARANWDLSNGNFRLGDGTAATDKLEVVGNIAFDASVSPVIKQIIGAGAGTTMTVAAQTAGGSNNAGGILVLQGGNSTGSGRRGKVQIQSDSVTMQVELVEIAASQRILSLNRGVALTTTQMPANTGDLVAYVGDAAVVPSASSVSGHIYYSDGAKPAWRTGGGDSLRIDMTSAATATLGANGAVPAQVSEYMTITYKGNTRKIPLFNN